MKGPDFCRIPTRQGQRQDEFPFVLRVSSSRLFLLSPTLHSSSPPNCLPGALQIPAIDLRTIALQWPLNQSYKGTTAYIQANIHTCIFRYTHVLVVLFNLLILTDTLGDGYIAFIILFSKFWICLKFSPLVFNFKFNMEEFGDRVCTRCSGIIWGEPSLACKEEAEVSSSPANLSLLPLAPLCTPSPKCKSVQYS